MKVIDIGLLVLLVYSCNYCYSQQDNCNEIFEGYVVVFSEVVTENYLTKGVNYFYSPDQPDSVMLLRKATQFIEEATVLPLSMSYWRSHNFKKIVTTEMPIFGRNVNPLWVITTNEYQVEVYRATITGDKVTVLFSDYSNKERTSHSHSFVEFKKKEGCVIMPKVIFGW